MTSRAEKEITLFIAEEIVIFGYRNRVGTWFLVREIHIKSDVVTLFERRFDKVEFFIECFGMLLGNSEVQVSFLLIGSVEHCLAEVFFKRGSDFLGVFVERE